MSRIRPTAEEVETAYMLGGVNTTPAYVEKVARQIRVVKPNEQCIIPDRKAMALKRISDMETELGRMMKLLNEMRADILHLTVE